jgi:hypothetical protein
MRLSLSVNDLTRLTASVSGPGYLSAHLNIRERPNENDFSKSVHVSGIQTFESETVFLTWTEFDLKTGDAVLIRVLDDGEGDLPTDVRRSSESPQNLFTNPELASALLSLVADFESRLLQLVERSEKSESPDEHKKFTTAVGHVMSEFGDRFLYPIYRRHKELVPNGLKGELL